MNDCRDFLLSFSSHHSLASIERGNLDIGCTASKIGKKVKSGGATADIGRFSRSSVEPDDGFTQEFSK